ncbi:YuzL family protein [Caldifermentibacillus hisashii]|uniref:YuzL family protein n=1 Tax=Caldifermentibacillus hisashii TaxID=996558 RepID=UPI003366C553
MSKRKADPSTIGLNSPETEGQGTTTRETGRKKADSSRKKASGISTVIKEDGLSY